jgi:hypothetical protein
MARIAIHCAATEDREQVVIEIRDGDRGLAHAILDASDTEALIRRLGQLRAALNDPVPGELDPGARIEFANAPAWKVPDTHSGPSDLVLALRHPGLGWLGFLLEAERAKEIGTALIETPPKRPSSP